MKSMKRRLATLLAVALVASTISFPGYAEPEDEYVYEDMELGDGSAGSIGRYSRATEGDTIFAVGGNELVNNTVSLNVGEDVAVAIATPANATIVSASSSNAAKVSVATSSNGVKVTAKETTESNAPVVVTVNYTVPDPAAESNATISKSADFTVIVKDEAETGQPSIALTIGKSELYAGDKTNITVQSSPSNATVKNLEAIGTEAVTITLKPDNSFDVEANPVEQDTHVQITVKATVNDVAVENTIALTVLADEPVPESGSLTSDQTAEVIELSADGEHLIKITASPSNAVISNLAAVIIEGENALEVLNTSTAPEADGSYLVTVKAKSVTADTSAGLKVSATVGKTQSELNFKFNIKAKAEDTKVTGVVLTLDKGTVYTYQKVLATAKMNPANANDTIKFVTDDNMLEQIGETVLKDGIATAEFRAKKSGPVSIRAIAEKSGIESNEIQTHIRNTVVDIVLDENVKFMKLGQQSEVVVDSVKLRDLQDDELLEYVKSGITYSSNYPVIVQVDEKTGSLKALKEGTATVAVSSKYAIGTAYCTITVSEKAAYHEVVFNTSGSLSEMDINKMLKINYILYDVKEDGTATDVTAEYPAVAWASSNPSVVSVDSKGVISTLKDGTAEIIFTVIGKDGKTLLTKTLKVTVIKLEPVSKDEATAYKGDEDVKKALSGEPVSKETAEKAGVAVGAAIEKVIAGTSMDALLKSEALGVVMNDIATIEKLLKENTSVEEKQPAVNTNKISGSIEVSGLMLNGFLNQLSAPQLSVDEVTEDIVIPKEIQNRKIAQTVAIDISANTDINIPIRIALPLPKGFTASNTMLLHYEDNDLSSATVVPCIVVDGKLVFTVGSFSPFVLVQTTSGSNNNSGSSSGSSGSLRPTEAGKWMQNDTGWWYRYSDGTWPANGWVSLSYAGTANWYHFDQNGYMQSGWFQDVDGRKYYLNPVSNGTKGAMMTGWQQIEGNWYYFNQTSDGFKGSLFVNTTTPDNYKVNENGVWVK